MSVAEWFNGPLLVDNLRYLLIGHFPQEGAGGLLLTLILCGLSMASGLVLGALLALLCWFFPPRWRRALMLVLELFRATPLLLLIFWLYFLLPIWLHTPMPDSSAVVLALGLYNGVAVMHLLYGAIAALPAGQSEAARISGLTRRQLLWHVLLPQIWRPIQPSLLNLLVALIKDTSLAYIVSVPELTLLTSQVNNQTLVYPLQWFLFSGGCYFLLCTLLSALASYLQRRERPAWL
jgi:amine acid ABC transporter, permease protein, 3-TM region, His/Glu/Gln/Arg/opine family